ncbi:MAG: DegQ family serine endoprotease [Lysobacteraceae bacterium]
MIRFLKFAAALSLLVGISATTANAQPPDFVSLVDKVSPAVVNIEATRTAEAAMRQRGQQQPDEEEIPEIFRRFFGQPGSPGFRMPQPRDRTSMGSGFIISADGYVLTNHHVIDGADEVVVRLADRRELDAEVVGSDARSDVAVLKVKGSGLPTVDLGDSRTLKPGQWVVAIGSPFGFDHSVTAGIVSAVGRASRMQDQQYVPFIQTDVPINRGNSGGPLFNTDGQVVGINSQIFSNTGGFMGVSFSIPIEVAMNSADQLKTKGRVSRGQIGVNIQDVDRDQAEALGLARPGGALVFGIVDGSAGEKAGLQVQDVILEFNGHEIARASDLPPLVGNTAPGSKVQLKVFRDGKPRNVTLTLGELQDDATADDSGDDEGDKGDAVLGLGIEALTADQRDELGLDDGEGVLITDVISSAARRADLQPGDVIQMIGKVRVGTVAGFKAEAAKATPGKPLMLLIRRGEASFFTAITPPEDGE